VTWDELIAEFRELGGVAENVRLGEGRLGRGIFVIDPAKPARLYAPKHLLIPAECVEIRDGRMKVKASANVDDRTRRFFEAFEEHFGWGAGLFDYLWHSQEEWNRLPSEMVSAVAAMGTFEDSELRVIAPTVDVCLQAYRRTRSIRLEDKPYFMHVIELVNHSSTAQGYDCGGGVAVEGRFEDEMLVCYNRADAWKRAVVSGFSDRSVFAHSIPVVLEISGQHYAIGREFAVSDVAGGIAFPKIQSDGNVTRLTFLTLGHSLAPDVPRAIFRKLMCPGLNTSRADEVFDVISHFNRTKFVDLLRTLRKYDSPITQMLADAAIDQLETLSYCVGARPLPDLPVSPTGG